MRVGQIKRTKIGSINAEVKYNGKQYLVRVPSISRQYIGDGKTISSAKEDTLKTLRRFKR